MSQPVIPPDFIHTPLAYTHRPHFIAFGDSITQRGSEAQGWYTLLSHYYSRRADFSNRGYSGYNTRMADVLLDNHLNNNLWSRFHGHTGKTVVSVFFGANDSVLPSFPKPSQHLSVDEYIYHLTNIIQRIKGYYKEGVVDIVVIGPPQVDGGKWAEHSMHLHGLPQLPPLSRHNDTTILYSHAAKQVAEATGAHFIELFSRTADVCDMLEDGLHLSAAGNRLLFELLRDVLDGEVASFRVSEMSVDGPHHRNVDLNDIHTVTKSFQPA